MLRKISMRPNVQFFYWSIFIVMHLNFHEIFMKHSYLDAVKIEKNYLLKTYLIIGT